MIKNNYESQLKNIQIDDKFLEKKKSLLLENKNNASIRAFNNIQRKDIILLKDVSNIFFLEKIYDKKLFLAFFNDFNGERVYIKLEKENIDKIIFVDNSLKINYFNHLLQDLNLLNVNDVVCIWSNNEKINIKILEIMLEKQNFLKSICIGIVMNQLKNNQKYNLLNNIFFRFENIFEIFHANIQITLK
jgi:hypothetical protein